MVRCIENIRTLCRCDRYLYRKRTRITERRRRSERPGRLGVLRRCDGYLYRKCTRTTGWRRRIERPGRLDVLMIYNFPADATDMCIEDSRESQKGMGWMVRCTESTKTLCRCDGYLCRKCTRTTAGRRRTERPGRLGVLTV
jgi:hypothetical protein